MNFFRYFLVLIFGAMGVLSVFRGLERLIYGGGEGPLAMQLGMGLGFLMFAVRILRSARTVRRVPAVAREKSPSIRE